MEAIAIKTEPGVMVPLGTHHEQGTDWPDVATNRFEDGFQIYAQLNPQGMPTGLESIRDNEGRLVGKILARSLRQQYEKESAPFLIMACAVLLELIEANDCLVNDESRKGVQFAKSVLNKARGIR